MRLPVDDRLAPATGRQWLEVALGLFLLLAYLSITSTGLTLTKEVMWANLDNDNMAAAIAIENRNQALASRTPEVQEFMARYSERVKPKSTS